MCKAIPVLLALVLFALTACQLGGSKDESDVQVVTVGPRLMDCVGSHPMRCMVVDGEYFYQTIEGFEFEEGFTYQLRIEKYDAFPDNPEPPADAGKYGYQLVEVVSKVPQVK